MLNKKRAAVVSTGWLGDTIACTAAATSLFEKGFDVTFYTKWQQLKAILDNDKRFKTVVYGKLISPKLTRPFIPSRFDLIVREPNGWSYKEPFTSEIRRIAGCTPEPEYKLQLSNDQIQLCSRNSNPTISISRDIYKRAYGRNIQELTNLLSSIAQITWVGLDPNSNSKKGKNKDLVSDAAKIYQSDLFIGPEGGLLWLAAGLGKTCIYFSEHIEEICKNIQKGNPRTTLGSKNHFPHFSHTSIPAYCSNGEVMEIVKTNLRLQNNSKPTYQSGKI